MFTILILSIIAQFFLYKKLRADKKEYFSDDSGLSNFASFLLVVQIVYTIILVVIYLP